MLLKDYDIADDAYYLFTCGNLAQREKEFLDKSKLDRLISTGSIEEFYRILQETYYGKYTEAIQNRKPFDKIMAMENSSIIEFLRDSLKPEHQILKEFYLLRIDLHNIKIIMKADKLDKDFEDIFIERMYSYSQLKEAYKNKKYENIDPETIEVLEYARRIEKDEDNQRIIELKLEQFLLSKMYENIEKTGMKMLIDFQKHTIDMLNIKNIYRAKVAEEEIKFEEFLYDNGFLPVKELKKFENESIDYLVQYIEKTHYLKMIFQGTQMFNTEHTFAAFERNEDEFILRFFDQVKFTVANLEKIAAFIMKKRLEMKNINIIYTGVLYDLARERIKRRVVSL